MRRVTAVLSGVAVVLVTAGVVAQAKPSFAGEWKIAGDPDSGGGRSGPGIDLTVRQSSTAMTVEYRAAGQPPGPLTLTCNLDGSASKNMTAGRGGGAPTGQASTAMWAGNTLVVTTTTASGEEKRTFSMIGDNLIVETSAPAPNGGAPNITKATYQRYERGHGG